jgi:hypothetical protein
VGVTALDFFWAAIVSVVQTKRIAIAYVKILGPKPADLVSMVLPLSNSVWHGVG